MKKVLIVILLLSPFFVNAQDIKGIKFSNAEDWNAVLLEAKKANKPIFVDAYATWCGPCKQMDREVYTDAQVAAFANANFISVKVQMDSTGKDNEFIKGWRKDASALSKYVEAYPSYLFFTAEGNYSGKQMGFYKAEDFLQLLSKAVDPRQSYIGQLREFKENKLTKAQLRDLALLAKSNKDDSVAITVARTYKNKYIDGQPLDSLLNPTIEEFRWSFVDLFNFGDDIIKYMYKSPAIADQKLGRYPGFSTTSIGYIIHRDYIAPFMDSTAFLSGSTPRWNAIEKTISKKFDKETAKRLVLNAKIGWGYKHKNWNEVARLEFEKVEKYGIDTTGMGRLNFNNFIYEVVFPNVDDPKLLSKAVKLMKQVIVLDEYKVYSRLDTYASILYKAGKKEDAVDIEKRALELSTKARDEGNAKLYRDIISKMERNEQIW